MEIIPDMFGWELLLANTRDGIQKKEDVLFLVIHFRLIKAGFKCAGVGDIWPEEDEIPSELPAENWNADADYNVRYIRHNNKCSLMSQHNGNVIIFNLVVTKKEVNASNCVFHYDLIVQSTTGTLDTMIPTHKEVMKRVDTVLLADVSGLPRGIMELGTFTTIDPSFVHRPPQNKFRADANYSNLMDVGRRDLDPWAAAGMGGGMLLERPRNRLLEETRNNGLPENLPRNSVHPRARFDPFGPPGQNYNGPDPDDMFS